MMESNVTSDEDEFAHCHTYPTTSQIYFYGNVIALLVVIIIGLVGNSIVAAVYYIDRVRNSSSVLLLSLAVLDNLLLISGLMSTVLHSAFPYTGAGHWFWDNKDLFYIICNPISQWAHTCSMWCMVLVTIDRYIVVSRPLKAAKLCTVRRAKAYALVTVICATVYNLPRLFEYELSQRIEPCSNETILYKEETTLMKSTVYRLGYTVVLYFLIIYVVPLITLTCMSGQLIRHTSQATKQRHKLTNKPRRLKKSNSIRQILMEDNVTRTVICIIVRFVVCTTPAMALQILILLNDPVQDTYRVFSNLLIYLNSSTNFIIFAVMGTRFRQVMCSYLCKNRIGLRRAAQRHRPSNLEALRGLANIAAPVVRVDITLEQSVDSADNYDEINECRSLHGGDYSESSSGQRGDIPKASSVQCGSCINIITIICCKFGKSTKTWTVNHSTDLLPKSVPSTCKVEIQ